MNKSKLHWENIYSNKQPNEVSWTQEVPQTSLDFIRNANLNKYSKIIDIGGGDSKLVDFLLEQGFEDVSVLDISEEALKRAQKRLGERASRVKWIVSDINNFHPTMKYDFWHDRATFHFLTNENEITNYLATAQQSINPSGVLVIGTFSEQGPKKCSGIEIKQYSEVSMADRLKSFFEKIKCITVDHKTPFDTIQNFVFCSFKKLNLT